MQMSPHVYAQQTHISIYCFGSSCNPHFHIHVAPIVAPLADIKSPIQHLFHITSAVHYTHPHPRWNINAEVHVQKNNKQGHHAASCWAAAGSSSAGQRRLQHCVITLGWLSSRSSQQAVTAWWQGRVKTWRPHMRGLVWPGSIKVHKVKKGEKT